MKYVHHISSLLLVMGILLIALTIREVFPNNNLISPLLPSSPSKQNVTPTPPIHISAWIPRGEEPRAIKTLQSTHGTIETVIPMWYELDSTGNLHSTIPVTKNELLEATGSARFYITPGITDHADSTRVTLFLKSKEKQQRAIQQLIDDADTYRFAGYTLFWQMLPSENSEAVLSFLQQLHLGLAASERILSYTVFPPQISPSNWGHTIGLLWPDLLKYVDSLHIMMYSDSTISLSPKPLIDLSWYENLIRFASEILPKDKIVIGLPLTVSHIYVTTALSEPYKNFIAKQLPTAVLWNRDSDSGEITATYSAQGMLHTLWREDKKSLAEKQRIARAYRLHKFSYWYIGGEDNEIWE